MGMFAKIVAVDSDGTMHVILRCVIIISAGPSNPSGAVDAPEKAKNGTFLALAEVQWRNDAQ